MEDLATRYAEYLRRARVHFGPPEIDEPGAPPRATAGHPGAFVKFRGRLIKFLTFAEFAPLFHEYTELGDRLQDILDCGDTINDVVLRLLRDRAAQLMLEPLL